MLSTEALTGGFTMFIYVSMRFPCGFHVVSTWFPRDFHRASTGSGGDPPGGEHLGDEHRGREGVNPSSSLWGFPCYRGDMVLPKNPMVWMSWKILSYMDDDCRGYTPMTQETPHLR